MLGRLRFSPDELGRMSFGDVILAIDGFNDALIHDYNLLRHQMWASLAAMGGKKVPSPKQIMRLPIDGADEPIKIMSKEEFLSLAEKMK